LEIKYFVIYQYNIKYLSETSNFVFPMKLYTNRWNAFYATHQSVCHV